MASTHILVQNLLDDSEIYQKSTIKFALYHNLECALRIQYFSKDDTGYSFARVFKMFYDS